MTRYILNWHGSYSGTYDTREEAEGRTDSTGTSDNFSIVEISEADYRPCTFCGGHVTSTNPDTDFCRNCYHSGNAAEREYGNVIGALENIDGVYDVGIWNSGGGCMILSMRFADGRYVTATSAYFDEASNDWQIDACLPTEGERWGFYVNDSEDSFLDGDEWDDSRVYIPESDEAFVALIAGLAVAA